MFKYCCSYFFSHFIRRTSCVSDFFCVKQNVAGSGKVYMQGFAPRIHPRQACSLGCIAKLRFAFQSALPADVSKKASVSSKLHSGSSRQTPFRPDSLQSITLSDRHYLPPGASRQTPHATYLSIPAHTIHSQLTTSIPA